MQHIHRVLSSDTNYQLNLLSKDDRRRLSLFGFTSHCHRTVYTNSTKVTCQSCKSLRMCRLSILGENKLVSDQDALAKQIRQNIGKNLFSFWCLFRAVLNALHMTQSYKVTPPAPTGGHTAVRGGTFDWLKCAPSNI